MPINRISREKPDRWLFVIIFLVLGALTTGVVLSVYIGESRAYQAMLALEELKDLETQDELIRLKFKHIVSDTIFLTNLSCLVNALETGEFSGVEREFVSFISAKDEYGQLRFLNAEGMEKIRVNSGEDGITVVPESQLQNKIDRYYVRDALNLARGDIYVSPLDLNVEQGKVETPFVPMIRFVSPVYIRASLHGFVIINFRAKMLLDDLGYLGSRNLGRFVLLNNDGYYLYSPDKEEEWGFMFPDRDKQRFSLTNPDLWNLVISKDIYQGDSRGGIVSSRIIHPLDGLKVNNSNYQWIALNIIPERQLEGNSRPLRLRLFFLGSLLFLLSSIPAWSISHAILRRRQARRELYLSANFDSLTSLPNRLMLNDRLEQTLSQSRRYGYQGAVLFIDLDGFKSVNDTHGHETGDKVLQEVAVRLNASLRESDTAARIGGDEFVVLVPIEESPDGINTLALKLIEVISQPFPFSGTELSIAASIGIRHFSGTPDQSPESLLAEADEAMYKAKSAGKGLYSVYGT